MFELVDWSVEKLMRSLPWSEERDEEREREGERKREKEIIWDFSGK